MRLSAHAEVPTFGDQTRWKEVATVKLRLATPMLGGGSEAGKPDLDQPIRPSSIRGALRHWWRASTAFTGHEDLRMRERNLWGMAGGSDPTSSRVRVEVECDPVKESRPLGRKSGKGYEISGRIPSYLAGFYSDKIPDLRYLEPGLEFSVKIEVDLLARPKVGTLPAQSAAEVLQALGSWLAYGGIGGRTRRGFGALEVLETTREGHPWEGLASYMYKNPPPGGPAQQMALGRSSLLGRTELVGPSKHRDAVDAWIRAAQTMQEFRRGLGRENRSPWPEADSLRARQGRKPTPEERYPRAEFGLPMNLHSPDRIDFEDDDLTFLLGDCGGRLPSPMLLRARKLGGDWRPFCVRLLSCSLASELGAPTDARGFPTTRPGSQANVLDAFLGYLRSSDWKEPGS